MLLFLDIDGVMVPAKGWKAPELLKDGFPAFSSKATRALQQIIDGGTTVILTTSHKSNYSIDEWKAIFRNRGLDINNLKTLPGNSNNLSRKEELLQWAASNHPGNSFIIIDDDKSLNELPAFLKDNLIQTSPLVGLTDEHVKLAEAILNRSLHTV